MMTERDFVGVHSGEKIIAQPASGHLYALSRFAELRDVRAFYRKLQTEPLGEPAAEFHVGD